VTAHRAVRDPELGGGLLEAAKPAASKARSAFSGGKGRWFLGMAAFQEKIVDLNQEYYSFARVTKASHAGSSPR
jgi:hypothetical protein